MFSVW